MPLGDGSAVVCRQPKIFRVEQLLHCGRLQHVCLGSFGSWVSQVGRQAGIRGATDLGKRPNVGIPRWATGTGPLDPPVAGALRDTLKPKP